METTDTLSIIRMKKEIDWSGKTILVADDVQTNFILLEAILKNTRARVIWAKNGQEAVEKCLDNEYIDLVLMDIRMPELNGIDATREIKKFRKDLPIIAQTAFTFEYEEKNILEAGCSQVLTKPLMPDYVLYTIGKYI